MQARVGETPPWTKMLPLHDISMLGQFQEHSPRELIQAAFRELQSTRMIQKQTTE